MLISHLFMRHKTPKPRFAPGVFIALIAIFAVVGQTKPLVGLAGLGTVLVVTAALIEANRQLIWENYRKAYRKQRGLAGMLTRPSHTYYTINVMFLWPFIAFLGVICLWAAYALA